MVRVEILRKPLGLVEKLFTYVRSIEGWGLSS
jgi:hypothetical protein